MSELVLGTRPLGFPWETADPFLFCAHHDDRYPAGNDALGPAASLEGRNLGQDFDGPQVRRDGWRMYHGRVVPGFPSHPHRGFETVTIVRRGLIDHSDSLGAAARFSAGDVQWLTAGRGIVHSEMFPLLKRNEPNPAELFQIWLNLPRADKLVEPHFSMLWREQLPRLRADGVDVLVVAGRLGDTHALAPPPKSWAAHPEAEVGIFTIDLAAGARFTLPPASKSVNRRLYFYRGSRLRVGDRVVDSPCAIALRPDAPAPLVAGEPCQLLLLEGRPINDAVVQYGPFVMNEPQEIQQAIADYRRTGFGGWPWPTDDPVHPRDEGRFARHADGRIERP